MPPDQVETTREVFVKELKDVPCRAHMFKDAVHGFAVRAYVDLFSCAGHAGKLTDHSLQ